jgi:release factor glutamine methyltransferase
MKSYEDRILDMYFKDDPEGMKRAKMRLENNEPLAYIVGEAAFYNEMYYVTPDTLIPRPDTEHIVEKALKLMPMGGNFADLCTGSGAIGISILKNSNAASGLLVDISEGALQVAKRNAERNGVSDKCTFICEDLNNLLLEDKCFDIIASNPPYVKTDVVPTLEKECSYEPYIAFDGGEDGMYFYRLILERFTPALKDGGYFVFEIGYDQKKQIIDLAKNRGMDCQVYRDYGGNDRVAVIKKNNP